MSAPCPRTLPHVGTHPRRPGLAFLLLVLPLLTSLAVAVAAAPLELVANGGFEDLDKDLPKDWTVNNAGTLTSTPDSHTGKLAARFVTREHEWGYCAFAGKLRPPLSVGAVYHMSIWAKGSGRLTFAVYQQSGAGFIGSRFLEPGLDLGPEWKKLDVVYKPEDRRIRSGAFAVHLHGKDAVATFDDAAFTFDPDENPSIKPAEPPPTTKLQLRLQTRDATARVLVAGSEVALQDGRGEATATEGLTVLGLQATATGPRPGVSLTLASHPEANGRFRVSAATDAQWTEVGFNDQAWPPAQPDADGLMWAADAAAKTCALRQVILWNATHYGPNRCLIPPVKEWGFPRGGVENLHLALYSPLPYRLDDYEFILDLPPGFRLLDKTGYQPRWVYNVRPQAIKPETVSREGITYTRLRMSHAPGEVAPDATRYSILPVQMETAPAVDTCRFYFRRAARGNFTELEQQLPVRVLPAVNGRMPRKVIISQYNVPAGVFTASAEQTKATIAQAVAAGCNYWAISYMPAWGEQWRDFTRLLADTPVSLGAHLILWVTNNYPLYGMRVTKHVEGETWKWAQQTPAACARYFGGKPQWGVDDRHTDFCPTYVMGEGAAAFREVLKQDYAAMLAFLPKTEIIWNDDERRALPPQGAEGAFCFCDRCKQAFRASAGLPADEELTDEALVTRYRLKWESFRRRQDGLAQGQIRQVCRELGRPYMVYSWSSDGRFWEGCKGNIDLAFPGCPGNSVADSYYQRMLDDFAQTFRQQTGLPRAVGQRFEFFAEHGKDGWKVMVLSDDGFMQPRTWKTQILRIVAALHGGVDLESCFHFSGGMSYWVGEATRIISEYEDLFWEGERADDLAVSDQVKYPNLLVLRRGAERLVLVFNETQSPLQVTLRNRELAPGQVARIFETAGPVADPAQVALTVPPEDVTVVHVR